MKVKIDIDTNTFVRFILVVLGFGAVILALYLTRSALVLIFISLFLALALSPPVNWIARHLPGDKDHRAGATGVAYLLVVSLLAGALVLIVPPVIEQSSRFASTVPGLIDQLSSQRGVVEHYIDQYGLNEQVDDAIDNAKSQASSIAANIGGVVVSSVGATLSGLINLLFVLVLTFLMLVEGPAWLKRIWGLYQDPERLERHKALVERMYRIVTGYVNGQLLVALIASLLTLIVVLILSAIFPLPANLAIPLAVIIFISALIPLVGATIGAVLVSLILALNSFPAAIIFAIYYIVYQQIENNLISPFIQSKAVELSALSVLVAILIGITLFGLLGAIIAIPVAGCIRILLNDYLEHSRKVRAEKSRNPVKLIKAKLEKAKEA